MEAERVKTVLNRGFRIHPGFPFPIDLQVTEVDGGIQIAAQPTIISVETGLPKKGIAPEVCSVVIPMRADDATIARGAHDALQKFLSHEASEVSTFNGERIVEPHPAS